jgi:hypothetical protein
MSYVVVTDPKTGEKYLDFKKGGDKPKPAPKQEKDKGLLGLGLQATDLFPTVGVPQQAIQTAVQAVTAGVQEFQKSGDFGKAVAAGQKGSVQSLEGNRPLQTIGRIGYNAARNTAQELSDFFTADTGAISGPTTSKQPDAPFLGVLPPLPKAKSSGPAEDLVTGIAQVALQWFPAFKAVGIAGKAATAVPGVTKALQGAGAAATALKGTKAVQAVAKVPGAKAVGSALFSNTLTKGAATGALIDVVGFDQHEGRLYDLVDNLQKQVTGTPLEVPVLSYLRSDPNDVGMEGRLKNALEGAGIGTAVESVLKILRAGKFVNQVRQAPAAEKPAAVAKVQEVVADLEDTMVRQATQAQEEAVAALPPAVAPEAPALPPAPVAQVVDDVPLVVAADAAPVFRIPEPPAAAAPAVSDEAIQALEKAYPYRKYRGQTPLDASYERLNKVKETLQVTQQQIEQLRANPPEPVAPDSPKPVAPSTNIPAGASRKITDRTDPGRIEIAAQSLYSWANSGIPGERQLINSVDDALALVRQKGAILDPDAIPGLDMATARDVKTKGSGSPETEAVAQAYRQFYGLEQAPAPAVASLAVTKKAQRDWDRNLSKFTQQEVQVKQDLVVAEAAVERLRGPATPATAAAVAEPPPVAKVNFTSTQRAELENMNSTLMREEGIDLGQGLTRSQMELLERTIRMDYAPVNQGGIEEISAATRRSMIGLADKLKKATDSLPAAAAPEPSVPSAGTSAPKTELPDTRGKGEFYHGAADEIKQLDEGYYENANVYGQGFYVTDDLKTAGSYTKKNAKSVAKGGGTPSQVIYRIAEAQPVRFYDLDAPLSPSTKQYLEQASEWSESVARALDEVDADPNIGLAKVMDEIRANSRSAEESRDVIQEVFEGLRETLEAEGYGGFTHVGGKLTKAGREHQVRIYWDAPNQIQLEKADPSAPAPAPAPPAQAAGPSPAEIQELDQALAMGRADLSPEQRMALRDQVLAEKYGTGSAVEPPAAAFDPEEALAQVQSMKRQVAEGRSLSPEERLANLESIDEQLGQLEDGIARQLDDGGDVPPIPPADPPVVVRVEPPDDAWANRLVSEIQQQNARLADGSITIDDLLENNVQKIQSPSGATQYVAAQPDMVQAYRAFADTFTRPEVTGIEAMNFDRVRSYARSWLETNGYNGDAIIDNLAPLSGALADAEQNVRALHLSGLYVDYTNKQAGIAANSFLNGKVDGNANIGQLTEELLVAAAAQKRANNAFESVTRPIGQLLRSTQIPRNLDDVIPGQVMPDAVPSGKNIAGEMEEALAKEQDVLVADSIGMPISQDTRDAIFTGVYTPQAMADLDALAQAMAQGSVTPGFARGFWDNFNRSVEIGARGLVMYRSAQLLSSGLTFWRNAINNTVRSLQLPLSQALGASVKGEFSRASQSLQIYGQYINNLQNSFRMATESFKVGRGLYDMDATSVDFLNRLAEQDAAGNAGKLGADARAEWTLNTMPWVDVQDKTVWGIAQKRLWQALNLSTRTQVSADTFFKSMVGQSFEHVRNLQPGLDHAVQMGMTPGSKEAWNFAQDYARAAVDKSLRDVTIDGKTILDAVMESPHAQTAMRYATFTDDIWAQMQPRTMSYGMDLAKARGLEGEAAQQFAMEYVQKGSSDVPVFSKTFSLMPGTWQKLMDLSPLFSIIQPFNRTPGDLVKSAARSTPLAPLVDTWWRDINSEDAFTRDRALGDIAIGMGAVSLALVALPSGRVEFTGGGPVEPTARRKWRDEGRQPYSFRFRTGEDANGNPTFSEWVPMQVFEPISNLMGALGDYQEISNKLPVEVRERLGSSLVIDLLTAVAAGQLSKTYYQGFMELYEAAMSVGDMDPGPNKRNAVMRYVSRITAGMVPYSSSLRAGRRYSDNELREVPASDKPFPMSLFEETLGEIRNMVPGWSDSLPPRLNWITGEPQVLTGVYGDQFIPADQPWLGMLFQLSPGAVFRGGAKQMDPVQLEMAQLSGRGAAFMGPRNTDFGRELRLSPFQMNDYVTSVSGVQDQFGRTLREALLEEINSPRYQELPRDEISTQVMGNRAASLNMVIQGFMKLGKEDFLSKHPEIRDSMSNTEGRNRDVQFRLKYGQPVDVPAFIEGLR